MELNVSLNSLSEWNELLPHLTIEEPVVIPLIQSYKEWLQEYPEGYVCNDEISS